MRVGAAPPRLGRCGPRFSSSRSRHLALALVFLAGTSLAHGVSPQATGVGANPWADGGLTVATTFGLLVTDDRCTWQWVCTQHLGLNEREVPSWHVSSSGVVFAGALSGLVVSRDRGCSFTRQPFFDETGVSQLVSANGAIWAVTGKYGVTNGLARSSDDGATFSWTAARAAESFFTAVRVAPSRPARIYLSSWYFEPPSARLWVSDDGAASFTTIDVSALGAAGSVFTVQAVDAQNPDLVYASLLDTATTPQHARVVRSLDAGRTFTTVFEGDGPVSSMVQAGGQWFLAVGDQLASSDDGVSFSVRASPTQRACVARVGEETLVCGRPPLDPFVVARVASPTPSPLLEWAAISGPVHCDPSSPAATACATTWPVEEAELGLEPNHEATCSAQPAPGPKPGCCQSSVGELSLVCLLFFRRPRRRVESAARR